MRIQCYPAMPPEIPGRIPSRGITPLLWIAFVLLTIVMTGFGSRVCAQVVTHPTAEITTSIKHYSYTDMLSPSQKKELEYIIVKASNGDIKTAFNACDVCYFAHKGYSQSGAILRCNNCGRSFLIDTLGNDGPAGTCNLGYLPHTIQGDQVSIKVSDLLKGEYFFLTQIVNSVDQPAANSVDMILLNGKSSLTIQMPGEAHRIYRIIALNGEVRQTIASSADVVHINTDGLIAGAYLLAVDEAGKITSRKFVVY